MTVSAEAKKAYLDGYFDTAIALASGSTAEADAKSRAFVDEVAKQRAVDIGLIQDFYAKLGLEIASYRGFDGAVSLDADADSKRQAVTDGIAGHTPSTGKQRRAAAEQTTLGSLAGENSGTMGRIEETGSVASIRRTVHFFIAVQLESYANRYNRSGAEHDGWFNPPLTLGKNAISSTFLGEKMVFAIIDSSRRDAFKEAGMRAVLDNGGNVYFVSSRMDAARKEKLKTSISENIITIYRAINRTSLFRWVFNRKLPVELNLYELSEVMELIYKEVEKNLDQMFLQN